MTMNKAQMTALMANVMNFVNTMDAPVAKAKAPAKAKAKAPAKPVKAVVPVEPGIHTTESFKAGTASIECFAGLSKKGRKYAGIRVADGYGRGMLLNVKEFVALVTILRTDTAKEVKAFLELHSA